MSRRTRPRPRPDPTPRVTDQARDELFYHVIHCGVIESDPAHHEEWFDATMQYMAGRYPELNAQELTELRAMGERFAQPPKRVREPALA